MREITDHIATLEKQGVLNEALKITVLDEPGQGGACHEYRIAFSSPTDGAVVNRFDISFQNGPIKEFGVNGISQESLLAIVIDRLRSFQAGPFASPDNAEALNAIEVGLDCLHRRTRDRVARGVEGLNKQ